jgi:hypothetical protein
MKPGASFAFGSLEFAINQDGKVAHQDDPMDTSSTNQVTNQIPDQPAGDDKMDTSSENSEQWSLRCKLGITRNGRDLDEFTKLQDDLDEDMLHHLTPTSTHEDWDSAGQPQFVLTAGDNTNPGPDDTNPGTSNANPVVSDLPRDGATASPSTEEDDARPLRLENEAATAAQAQHGTKHPPLVPPDHNHRCHRHHVSPAIRRGGADIQHQIDDMQVEGTMIYATP